MEENIKNLKILLQDLEDVNYNESYIKSLKECITRIEETLCLDTINDNHIPHID